jgi:hypothetical protein
VIAAASSFRRRPLRARDRVLAGCLLALMAIGSLALWMAVPLGSLWAISQATDTPAEHFVASLIGVPVAMILFAPLLFWLNGLYLRVTGVYERFQEEEEPRQLRGPLEPLLLISFVLAATALTIWLVVGGAETPPFTVW